MVTEGGIPSFMGSREQARQVDIFFLFFSEKYDDGEEIKLSSPGAVRKIFFFFKSFKMRARD